MRSVRSSPQTTWRSASCRFCTHVKRLLTQVTGDAVLMAPSRPWRPLPVFVLCLCVACVAPARSYGAYESKAATTAGDALSAVETARLAVVAVAKHDAFAPYLSV